MKCWNGDINVPAANNYSGIVFRSEGETDGQTFQLNLKAQNSRRRKFIYTLLVFILYEMKFE